LLRRSSACAWGAGPSQLSWHVGVAGSDREFPRFTARSGTQRARAYVGEDLIRSSMRSRVHGSGGGGLHLSNLCILPAWTRSLISPAAETIPRIFRIMDTSAVTARALQGMARVRSGQAPAWPLVSDRSVRSGSRVKREFACTLAGVFPPVLVALRSQSRLRLEGRTRTLSGPSPDLSPTRTLGA
jgi:hypothetical protein